jgi:hypothetical protein
MNHVTAATENMMTIFGPAIGVYRAYGSCSRPLTMEDP